MNKKVKKELWKLLAHLAFVIIITLLINLLFLCFGIKWDEPKEFIERILIGFFAGVFVRYAIYYWNHLLSDKQIIKVSIEKNTTLNLGSEITKQLFCSLFQKFIKKDSTCEGEITLTFKEQLNDKEDEKNNKIQLGRTAKATTKPKLLFFKLEEEYDYTVFFLKDYPSLDYQRQTIVHEFTHLYLNLKSKLSHEHDDAFYAKMDYFEDWLDKKWNLSPRQDKWDDWVQHINPERREWREEFFEEKQNNKTLEELKQKNELLKEKVINQTLSDIAFYTREIERWENELKFWQEKAKTKELSEQNLSKKVSIAVFDIAKIIESLKENLAKRQDTLKQHLIKAEKTKEEHNENRRK